MPLAHSHDAWDETIYGLKCRSTWTMDGETIDIDRGASLRIRRGVSHGFTNRGSEKATFLAIASPGVFGPAYFREIGEVAAAAAAAGGPPDQAAIAEVMRRHGLTPTAANT